MVDANYFLRMSANLLRDPTKKSELKREVDSIDQRLGKENIAPAEKQRERDTAIMGLLVRKGYVSQDGDKYRLAIKW